MNTKKIIVVDDEGLILGFLHTLFTNHFECEVLLASSGKEAIDLAKENGLIDLLITDVRMPEMDGQALAAYFAKHYPKTNILFMSGFTKKEFDKGALTCQKVEFIAKPFTFDELKSKLEFVL